MSSTHNICFEGLVGAAMWESLFCEMWAVLYTEELWCVDRALSDPLCAVRYRDKSFAGWSSPTCTCWSRGTSDTHDFARTPLS